MAAAPTPSRSITPGRKFSITTSAAATSPVRGGAAGGALQVQLHDLLAAVEYRSSGRGAGGLPGAVDLDHLGALVGEQHAGQRSGEVVAKVDHANARQRR